MKEIKEEVILAYTLANAIHYGGKADPINILNALFSEGLDKENIEKIKPRILEAIKVVDSMNPNIKELEFERLKKIIHYRKTRGEEELPELPEAKKGEVIMRVAPFPSGPLHIGNARAVVLNSEYVKKYSGKLFLFYDDTIGNELKPIEPRAYSLIKEGIHWMKVKPNKILYKSDRLTTYYSYADELIKKGYMYVCSCSQEEFQRIKEKGVECSCRHLPNRVNYLRWKEMFNKNTPEGRYVVRLKTSMQDPDPAFRDRVMFKISYRPHPRTKNKFSVYPSMEFSWAIDDSLIGTTHVLRGIEHQISTRVQDFIRKIFGWKNPISIYHGLLEIEGIKISKSKGASEVRSGQYSGWNDSRLWSLQSLKDRGIRPETIRKFILKMGLNKSNALVPIEVLYSLNRKELENVPVYFFVEKPIKIKINGAPESELKIIANKRRYNRKYLTGQEFYIPSSDYHKLVAGIYRLIHLLTFKVSQINITTPKYFSFKSQDFKKGQDIPMIPWLPINQRNVPLRIRLESGRYIEGIGEPALNKLKEGQEIKFELFGFVKLHKKNKSYLEFWFAHS